MGNKNNGEVGLEIDGEHYTLRLSINQIIELEDELNLSVNEIAMKFGDAAKLRMGFIRSVFKVALRGGGHDLDPEAVGELIAKITPGNVNAKIGEALQATFPEAEAETTENPPEVDKGGIGTTS